MDHQNVQSSQDMNLVLSTDAKPRLKWTPELHQRFVDAANQLGGADKATPKSLMRMMGIPGLTLYHLKSHLQKYRLGKHQQSEISRDSKRSDTVDCEESCSMNELNLFCEGNEVNDAPEEQIQENGHIADAIQMQMEVQRKLHEQIEVQRHLQLRIEAQGKYLQKVLKKAHETISGYNCSADGVEHAKAELSQLVSMVSTPSFSEITETTDLSLDNLDQKFKLRRTGCSVESSVTSSESSDKIDDERDTAKISHESGPFILPLLDKPKPRGLSSRKRSRSTTCEGNFVKQKCSKKSKAACIDEMGPGLTKFGLLETIDLNSQCELDLDLGPKQPIIDLNSQVHI